MAMYVMEEMPDIHGTGEQVLYPRFAMMDQVSTFTFRLRFSLFFLH